MFYHTNPNESKRGVDMVGIRFMSVSVLVMLITLGVAVSPVHARMGGMCGGHGGGGGEGGDSEVISSQINDIVAKYNGNHSGLMQAFSGEFGDTFYIVVKKGHMSRSKYVYEGLIDPQGYVTVNDITSGGRRGYDCDSNICVTTTKGDVSKAYSYLMSNNNDYLTLDDVATLSIKLWKTWSSNLGLLSDILDWIQDEYLP